MRIEEIIRGMDSLEKIIKEMTTLQKDAVLFIADKNLWDEFMKFHAEKHLERRRIQNARI
jgi:hypothetical protein